MWPGTVPQLLTVKYGYPVCENLQKKNLSIFLLYIVWMRQLLGEIFISAHWGEPKSSDYFRIIAIISKWYFLELSSNRYVIQESGRKQFYCPALYPYSHATKPDEIADTVNNKNPATKTQKNRQNPAAHLNKFRTTYGKHKKNLQNMFYDVHNTRAVIVCLRTTKKKWFFHDVCSVLAQ